MAGGELPPDLARPWSPVSSHRRDPSPNGSPDRGQRAGFARDLAGASGIPRVVSHKLRATRNPRSTTRVAAPLSSSRCVVRSPVGLDVHDPPLFTRFAQSPSVRGEPSVGAPTKFATQQSATHSKTLPSVSYRPNALGLKLPTGASVAARGRYNHLGRQDVFPARIAHTRHE
jgi:hypothetical protein